MGNGCDSKQLLQAIIEATREGRLQWHWDPQLTGIACLGPWTLTLSENDEGLPVLHVYCGAIEWAFVFEHGELFDLHDLVVEAVNLDKEREQRAYNDLMRRLQRANDSGGGGTDEHDV